MDKMVIDKSFWSGRKVFLTGHTGFKGSWLCLWLNKLGAEVTGYSLEPPSSPSMFYDTNISKLLRNDIRGDILNYEKLKFSIESTSPEIIIHMAAQSLVQESYKNPIQTYQTNVIGTANVLMISKNCSSVKAIISVASDKCYQNFEWVHPYRENDRLGGHDPYSSSKACAEILASSISNSFKGGAKIASVRAGNVIGGGDWAQYRLIPDCIRSFSINKPLMLRYPNAVRPWQLVLEPLAGYLLLAQCIVKTETEEFTGAWNFGPQIGDEARVVDVATRLSKIWSGKNIFAPNSKNSITHEANLLRIDSTKSKVNLGWQSLLKINDTIKWTADWYKEWSAGNDLLKASMKQIESYEKLMQ